MKKIFLIILSTLLFNRLFAQEVQFGFDYGVGTFSMSDLKKVNDNIIKDLPVVGKVVSNFPAYWYYQPVILLKGKNFGMGISYRYHSTGSRVSYQDYSGEYKFDTYIHSNSPSIFAEMDFFHFDKLQIGICSNIGFLFSNLKWNEYLKSSDSVFYNTVYKFTVENYFVEPGLFITYRFDQFGLKLHYAYLFQFGSDNFENTNKESNLSLTAIKSQWNGQRFGITLFYSLKLKQKTNSDANKEKIVGINKD